MIAFYYPESIQFLAILKSGNIAHAGFLVNPDTHPGLLIAFALILQDDTNGSNRAISYLGYYSAATDTFRFINHPDSRVSVLADLGRRTIEHFWPDQEANVSFHNLHLNHLTGHGEDPLARCQQLSEEQTAQVVSFFDRDFTYTSRDDNVCPVGTAWFAWP